MLDWENKFGNEKAWDKEYGEMAYHYCETGHLEEFDDQAERKSELKEKYKLINKYQLNKLLEVNGGETKLSASFRKGYDNMVE